MGFLSGGLADSGIAAASADGSVLVGWSDSSTGWHATRWTAADGMKSLGELTPGGASTAYGVAADGAIVVGTADGAAATGRSCGTSATGWPAAWPPC